MDDGIIVTLLARSAFVAFLLIGMIAVVRRHRALAVPAQRRAAAVPAPVATADRVPGAEIIVLDHWRRRAANSGTGGRARGRQAPAVPMVRSGRRSGGEAD